MQPLLFPLDNILLWILECQHRRLCYLMSLLFHLQTSIQRRNINVPTLPLPDRHLAAQRHGITQDTTPTAMTSQLLTPDPSFRSGTSLPPPTPWTHPLCGNMIQPHDSHYYLGSPVQAGRGYISNDRNPLQPFDPNLPLFKQGFVRYHQGQ